jgi:hypothetical protein
MGVVDFELGGIRPKALAVLISPLVHKTYIQAGPRAISHIHFQHGVFRQRMTGL